MVSLGAIMGQWSVPRGDAVSWQEGASSEVWWAGRTGLVGWKDFLEEVGLQRGLQGHFG